MRLERTREAVLLLYRFPEWVGEPPRACTVARDVALAELEQAEAALEAARVIYEAECKDWTRLADPSDPDEELPPWQGRWEAFASALAGSGEGTR